MSKYIFEDPICVVNRFHIPIYGEWGPPVEYTEELRIGILMPEEVAVFELRTIVNAGSSWLTDRDERNVIPMFFGLAYLDSLEEYRQEYKIFKETGNGCPHVPETEYTLRNILYLDGHRREDSLNKEEKNET